MGDPDQVISHTADKHYQEQIDIRNKAIEPYQEKSRAVTNPPSRYSQSQNDSDNHEYSYEDQQIALSQYLEERSIRGRELQCQEDERSDKLKINLKDREYKHDLDVRTLHEKTNSALVESAMEMEKSRIKYYAFQEAAVGAVLIPLRVVANICRVLFLQKPVPVSPLTREPSILPETIEHLRRGSSYTPNTLDNEESSSQPQTPANHSTPVEDYGAALDRQRVEYLDKKREGQRIIHQTKMDRL